MRDWLEEHSGLLKIGLFCIVTVGVLILWYTDPPVRVGPGADPTRRVLILLHGHGASKSDLEPLARKLAIAAPEVTFILPSAPHKVGMGRTWYPSFTTDTQEEVAPRLLELRDQARNVVMAIVEDVRSDGVPDSEIYVGGFSQGATVALDVVLTEPGGLALGGLVSMSGGALSVDLSPLDGRAPLRAFVSHGKSDGVLGGSTSKTLVRELEETDHEVTFIEFAGGHAIPTAVVTSLGAFLSKRP